MACLSELDAMSTSRSRVDMTGCAWNTRHAYLANAMWASRPFSVCHHVFEHATLPTPFVPQSLPSARVRNKLPGSDGNLYRSPSGMTHVSSEF